MCFLKICLFSLVVCGVIDAQLDCSIVLHGTYDYIIVGGGTSGSVIASRLSEDPDIRVLLLEAGKADDDIFESHVIDTPGLAYSLVGSSVDWKYETEPQQFCCGGLKNQKVRLSRGMVLGGTSAIDSMEHIRGSQHVFNEWEESGAKGWNFTNVKDFFKMAEDVNIKRVPMTSHRGQCGPLHVTEQKDDSLRYSMFKAGTNEMGWPVMECNIAENIGLCRSQLTVKQGNRISSSKAYLNPVQKRVNLDIQTEAKVVKINIDEYDLRATGVNFIYRGKNYTIKARHDVILAAGPVETPKLLMLSGIGRPDQLVPLNITVLEDLPVGENLQDGYVVPLRLYVNVPTYRPDKPMENVQRWRDYIYLRRGELADGLLDAHYFLRTLPSKPSKYPDISISVVNMLPDNDHSLLMKMNVKNEVRDTWYKQGRGKNGVLLEVKLMHAESRGVVRLRSADPNDPPIINPNYLREFVDVEDLRKGIEFIQSLSKTVAFKSVSAELEQDLKECENYPTNSQDYWRCYIRFLGYSSNQLVGTARMGRIDDNTTVVDSSLRVKGIKGLRVADASIMPQSTGSTRSSVIMIGEKAADIIKKDLEEFRNDPHRPQTFISSVKTTESSNMDSLTASVYDTTPSLVKLENTEPIDPVTAPLSSASEADLLSMFEQLIMDPVSSNPQPTTETKAGSLTEAVDLGANILDRSGRLTEDALLKLVGAASGSPSSNSLQSGGNPAMNQPSQPLEIAKAARNAVKHTKENRVMDISTADIFAEIQNLSMDVQRITPTAKQPSINPIRIERKRVSSGTNDKSQTQSAGVFQQQSITNRVNPKPNTISAPTRHRVINMHSLLNDRSAPKPANKVIDMHSLLNDQTFSLPTKDSKLPDSLAIDGALKTVSKQDRERGLRLLTDSLQRSRVSSVGTESLFDQHKDIFPSTEPDVLNFASDAGSLQTNNFRTHHSNHRRDPLIS